ncbi:MAG: hypothetical protein COC05_04385 [Gammaproteobacteria bacterium]|nr:MAG: hypothetical protein COC05_04385 [Gammaproteobacteria bacterium]
MALPKGKASELALYFDNEKHGRGVGVLHFRAFTQGDQITRAILSLIYCLLAAALTVPILLLHWITVPGFVIGGFILFVQQLRAKKRVINAVGQCPVHGGEVDIRLDPNQWPPAWVHCPECNASLQLVADSRHKKLDSKVEQ